MGYEPGRVRVIQQNPSRLNVPASPLAHGPKSRLKTGSELRGTAHMSGLRP